MFSGCVFEVVEEVKVLVERSESRIDRHVVSWVNDGEFEISEVGLVEREGNGRSIGVS